MSSEKLMIVDGNSILNRAFYGMQGRNMLRTSKGRFTNAVYGFINIISKFIDEESPTYLCVAFDLKAPTFRHLEFEGYKAKRKPMPAELVEQVPLIKEVLDAMNIKRLEYEGYEADDIIGSISLDAEKSGMETIILTGDKDSFQLLSDKTKVKIPVTRMGKTDTEVYDLEKLKEKYGVTPLQFIDVKGLMGDPSDNIPGVPGIGEKTAITLIQEFDSIENLYENISDVTRETVKEKLTNNRELAFISKRLATIERNMPKMCDIHDLKRSGFDKDGLFILFKELEFKNFIDKFNLAPVINIEKTKSSVKNITKKEEIEDLKKNIIKNGSFAFYCPMRRDGNSFYKPVGAGISLGTEKSCYINFNGDISEDMFFDEMKGILENETIKKSSHDAKNLIVYLLSREIKLSGFAFDTMIAAYIIDPSSDTYTLKELAEKYLNRNIDSIDELTGKGKNQIAIIDIPNESLSFIAGIYAETISTLEEVLHKIIAENNQEDLYYKIELPLVTVLSNMEFEGFKVDRDGLITFSAELEDRINVLTDEIFELSGEEFNINSPKQLGVILFEKLRLPVIKRTKTGYSTDVEVLEELKQSHEMIPRLLEYRQLVKLKSTYVEGLLNVINPDTGKIHSSFKQTVAVTGRISSTEPNLQNIPIKIELGRMIRKVFIPSNDEFVLLDADYSQIELRVLADITDDENMIEAFKNNEDIHTITASQVFGIKPEEVTQQMRSSAKAVNFGIVYGIGEFSLAKDIGVSRKEAKKYIDGYLEKYHGVRNYMKEIVEKAKKDGYVTTIFGRRRYLPELSAGNFNVRALGERLALNTPIQGTAADIIKIAMVNVFNELSNRHLKSKLILQVHDELIIETSKDEIKEVADILKNGMENAVKMKVPLLVEVKQGNNWYETK